MYLLVQRQDIVSVPRLDKLVERVDLIRTPKHGNKLEAEEVLRSPGAPGVDTGKAEMPH